MESVERSAGNGRDRLLDAAESLFAKHGYDGASLRDIARSAGVEVGLATYHFQSKNELFRQVLRRRAPEMAQALGEALDRAIGSEPRDRVEAILHAYAMPHLDRLHGADTGWHDYVRLAAYCAIVLARGELMEPAAEIYLPVMDRFEAALIAALPDHPRDELYRAYYLFRMSILSISLDRVAGMNPARSGDDGAVSRMDVDALGETIVRVHASGFLDPHVRKGHRQ